MKLVRDRQLWDVVIVYNFISMKRYVILALGIVFLDVITSSASHIGSGYITVTAISNDGLTNRISLVLFTNTGSSVQSGGGEIDFGDGTKLSVEELYAFIFFRPVFINSDSLIAMRVIEIQHTYSAPGTYTIGYLEKNRNAGVVNFSNSVDTPFYISSVIRIDSFLGLNSLPDFQNYNVPHWVSGRSGYFNFAAFDQDGDSLSYTLGIPKQDKGKAVDGYALPSESTFYGSQYSNGNEDKNDVPKFEIDPISGDLVWDAPGSEGEYTALIIVDEWRKVQEKRYKVGSISYDIQMIVRGGEVSKPSIVFPDNQCYVEKALIEETFLVESLSNVKVNLYTHAVGARINNVPIAKYDFDTWKASHDLTFSYDSKNTSQEYYKVVLSLEQESAAGANYFWSKAFVFGIGCDEIVPAPTIVTSIEQPPQERVSTYLTNTSGHINVDKYHNDQMQFQLFSLNGKIVVDQIVSVREGKGRIQYESIPNGIYIVHMEIDSHFYKRKIVVR